MWRFCNLQSITMDFLRITLKHSPCANILHFTILLIREQKFQGADVLATVGVKLTNVTIYNRNRWISRFSLAFEMLKCPRSKCLNVQGCVQEADEPRERLPLKDRWWIPSIRQSSQTICCDSAIYNLEYCNLDFNNLQSTIKHFCANTWREGGKD